MILQFSVQFYLDLKVVAARCISLPERAVSCRFKRCEHFLKSTSRGCEILGIAKLSNAVGTQNRLSAVIGCAIWFSCHKDLWIFGFHINITFFAFLKGVVLCFYKPLNSYMFVF